MTTTYTVLKSIIKLSSTVELLQLKHDVMHINTQSFNRKGQGQLWDRQQHSQVCINVSISLGYFCLLQLLYIDYSIEVKTELEGSVHEPHKWHAVLIDSSNFIVGFLEGHTKLQYAWQNLKSLSQLLFS